MIAATSLVALFVIVLPPFVTSQALKHMRNHGRDHHKHKHMSEEFPKTSPVGAAKADEKTGFGTKSKIPPGIDVAPRGYRIPGPPYEMRAGYRDYCVNQARPPWGEGSATAPSQASVLAFLDAAEAECEAVRARLRGDYGAALFGGGHGTGRARASTGTREKGLGHFSQDPEEVLANRIAANMLASGKDARHFTIAVTGQSNAAGHGSYFDESFPFPMARAVASAFSKAGLSLRVQNFAVGGGRTMPTTGWCGISQVGPEVDLAIWDFTMTEGGKSEVQGEAWVRSMLSPSRVRAPAGLIFLDRGRASRWAPAYKHLAAFLSLHKPEAGLALQDNSTALKPLLRFLHPDCKSYAAKHGEEANVLCRKDKWNPAKDLMQWKSNGKGKLIPSVYDASGKRVGGGCPGMNPWHDGWKLHRLKGSVLAHFLSRVLSQALTRAKEIVMASSRDHNSDVLAALASMRVAARGSNQWKLPKPGRDCLHTPHCDLIDRLACATASQPAVLPPLRAIASSDRKPIALSLDSANGRKRAEEATCHMGHLDHKYSVLVQPSHGWTSFQMPDGLAASATLVVCEPPTGWNRDPRIAELSDSKAVQWRRITDKGVLVPMKAEKIEFTKACYDLVEAAFSERKAHKNATLQVKATTSKDVRIDHVIWQKQ